MSFIDIKNLKVHYPIRGGFFNRIVDHVYAVDGVDLMIEKGKTYGLVGESGSGKSTIGKAIIGLEKIKDGTITYEGKVIEKKRNRKSDYNQNIQMIFQDSLSSLNPKKRIIDIIAEPLRNFENLTDKEERRRVSELLEIVGMTDDALYKYPHEFSGGQRQRIGIARALAVDPEVLVCDEPISALDVSIQAQVVNLLKDLQKERNLTLLFIAHDLSMVKYISDRVAVMYRGKVVELGTPEVVYSDPVHSYTKSLISAVPIADPDFKKTTKIDMEESYLRSPMGDVSEIGIIPETPELTEYKPGHFVETSFLKEKGLI